MPTDRRWSNSSHLPPISRLRLFSAGVLASDNWYDFRFSVLDAHGVAYAQVQKHYEGYAQARLTSADRYVVSYAPNATPIQRAIALASAIAMDIALYSR